jgi:hypothetical protein
MKHYDTTFFCAKDEGPRAHVKLTKGSPWATLLINTSVSDSYLTPRITLFIFSFEDLIRFKESLVSAIEDARSETCGEEADRG